MTHEEKALEPVSPRTQTEPDGPGGPGHGSPTRIGGGGRDPHDHFKFARDEIQKVLLELPLTDEARPLLQSALDTPVLSIAEEMDLYKNLEESGSNKAESAKSLLVLSHLPIAVSVALRYRSLGVSIAELVDAAQKSLTASAQAYNFPPRKQHRSFWSVVTDELDEAVLDRLDEWGVETIDPAELIDHYQKEDRDDIKKLTEFVRPFDLDILYHRFGRGLSVEQIEERMGYHNVKGRLEKALRRLRRPLEPKSEGLSN